MGIRFDVDVFKGSFRYSLIQTFRSLNAGWFIGLEVLGPISFLLTSWTIFQILGQSSLSYFRATSGYADYIPFVILGFAFQAVIMNAAWSGANSIRSEQWSGTVEAVFMTPSSKSAWLLGKISGNVLMGLLSTIIVLIVGTLGLSFVIKGAPNVLAAAIGIVLTLAGMTAFSFALAGLTFLAKRVEDINQVLWTSMIFFTGLAFPVEALPPWAQAISSIFPITHGLAITRSAILNGYGISDPSLSLPLLMISVETLVYIPLGYFSFQVLLNRAKQKGMLGSY